MKTGLISNLLITGIFVACVDNSPVGFVPRFIIGILSILAIWIIWGVVFRQEINKHLEKYIEEEEIE